MFEWLTGWGRRQDQMKEQACDSAGGYVNRRDGVIGMTGPWGDPEHPAAWSQQDRAAECKDSMRWVPHVPMPGAYPADPRSPREWGHYGWDWIRQTFGLD